MAAGFNKIGWLQRFGRVFSHYNFLEQRQNAVFKAYAQRITPSFFQMIADIKD